MAEKIKVVPFNDLPFEERAKIIYYIEENRARTLDQTLHMLQNDIGINQKRKIRKWIADIEQEMQRQYEVIKNETNI